MICPLLAKYNTRELPFENPIPVDCFGVECAWFDLSGNRCYVKALHQDLVNLFCVLKAMLEKMPHEEQFRK